MKPWYNLSSIEIIEGLKSDLKNGLKIEQIEENRELYGNNTIIYTEYDSILKISLGEVRSIWSIFIIFFIASNVYISHFYISTIYAILYITIIAFIIYYKRIAQGKAGSFDKFNFYDVEVLRAGCYKTISAEDIVVGDIIIVNKDMYVPADIRVITSNELKVNELPITGKNVIEEKYSAKINDREIFIEDMSNMLFKSSVIVSGDGIGVVVGTGMNTEIGILISADEQHKNQDKFLKSVKNVLNIVAISLGVIYTGFITIGMYRKTDINLLLDLCTNITIAAFPFMIVIEILLIIRLFIFSNKKKSIYINNISFLEKLSNIKSIFLEKKGVLAHDEFLVSKIFIDSNMLVLDEKSYFFVEKSYEGNRLINRHPVTLDKCDTLKRLIEVAILCNEASFDENNKKYSGDVREIAMLQFIHKASKITLEDKNKHKRLFTIPALGSKQIKTSVNNMNGRFRANIFGPFENILECCTSVFKNGLEVELTNSSIDILKESAYDMNVKGMEVFGIAYRNFNYKPSEFENIQSNLVLVGLIGMENPIKESTYELNNIVSNLGMDVVVFTQENKLSLKYFGEETNIIPSFSNVYSGVELMYMTSNEINNIINHENLFSNLSEEQKVAIVNEHKTNRGMVCVLASKLISVPHLSMADIPISFGVNASNVVKRISNIHFDYINVKDFFNFMFESNELVKTCSELSLKAIEYSILITIPILIEAIIINSNITNIADLIYLQFIVIGISALSIISNNRKKTMDKDIMNYLKINEKNHSKISRHVKKGIIYGIIAYFIYFYVSKEYANFDNNTVFLLIAGVLISVSTLLDMKKSKTKRSFRIWIFVLLNIALLILYCIIKI